MSSDQSVFLPSWSISPFTQPFSLGPFTSLLRKQGRKILSLARKPSNSLQHMFNSIFFRGLRPHRTVWGICASIKPHRFSWSLSAEAWSPTMTFCKQLETKVLIFFLLIKISGMFLLKACISNQHNQPLIWLITLAPTVPYRHAAPVLGRSSKLSAAWAASFQLLQHCYFLSKTNSSEKTSLPSLLKRIHFNLKAPTQIIQLDTRREEAKALSLHCEWTANINNILSPSGRTVQHFDFFYPSSNTLPSVYRGVTNPEMKIHALPPQHQ